MMLMIMGSGLLKVLRRYSLRSYEEIKEGATDRSPLIFISSWMD
jgi:hypothetical protein